MLSALVLPVTREPLFPANAMFLLVIVLAATARTSHARRYRQMLPIAATLPLGAALIYMMWPSFPGNYALPYVLASACTFALALTTLWEGSSIRRAIGITGACVVIGYGALLTHNGQHEYASARLLDADMARVVSEHHVSQLITAVDDPQLSGGFSRGLALYSRATRGAAPPGSKDVDCVEALRLSRALSPDMLLLRSPGACAPVEFPTPTVSVRRTAPIVDWKTFRVRPGELTADFWVSTSP